MIVGTPPNDVIFSSSMICIAMSGSNLPTGISTSLAPDEVVQHHRREAAGDVEQRHDEQRGRPQRRVGLGRRGAAHRRGDAAHDDVLEVGDRLAVRERRALRLTRRARRVEDREQIVLVDEARRHARVARIRDELGERTRRRVGRVGADDEHVLQLADLRQPLADHREALDVGDQHLGARVDETELELLGLPPRVQRHEDRAEDRARPPRDHPLGNVRGHQRDPIAALDAELGQLRREHARAPVVLAERVALRRPARAIRTSARAPRSRP